MRTWRAAVVALGSATDEALYGGKAANLAIAVRAGLPVPPGLALSWPFVDAIAEGTTDAQEALRAAVDRLPGGSQAPGRPLAVRSSAPGEDSARASFAGQHLSCLNVNTPEALTEAVQSVRESARAPAALAYRDRLGLVGPPCIAVVVQALVAADCAGVLFTRDPLDGSEIVVVEASWGLGESVVEGLVVPDRYRIDGSGRVLERVAGMKDIAVRPAPFGGTSQVAVPPERVRTLCLDDAQLTELRELASRCVLVFGGAQDLEWAFADGHLHLLQRRPLTVATG
ncbi:PEP/pyruvate-binding domain-containing protein [Streptomyces sp. ISL-43]|uniref:PEP/pyruvate-binding domain-containing protein n=1 Tax=Streptomyces sp. ISL-43 TaxID=2819183 RepID=UPI001BE5C0CE|nr:PEP/pyruvate-binding domain-containing protein [Streptomyces sp. ISL-43]MBT2445614.1 PEP/pyruvate-binding domain-containing protein [Streptomyces sp. ISL-43]